MNNAEAALIWIANQIPDFEPKSKEDKMLLVIKQYCTAGADEIARLTEENERLSKQLTDGKCVYLSDSETAEGCVQSPCPNYKTVEDILKENAELTRKARELEQELAGSIKIPFKVIDKTTGKQADEGYISKNEDWAQYLIYCDMDGFAVTQDGNIILLDETGKFVYCPFERFEIVKDEDEQ